MTVLFGLLLAACDFGGAPTTTTTTTTTLPTPATTTTTTEPPFRKPYGGEAIIGIRAEPASLNPFMVVGDLGPVTAVGNTFLTGVYRIDGDTLELIPDVVTELPNFANGGISITDEGMMRVAYTIVEDAVWADGTPISGDDFLFTYETIMSPELAIHRAVYEDIDPESIETGPKSFEFTLLQPTLEVEFLFPVILPRHDVEGSDFANDFNDRMWVSGGPFVFEEWVPGSHIRVVRNPNYWRIDPETEQQLPYLDAVTFSVIPDAAALLEELGARRLDVAHLPGSPDTITAAKVLEADGARVEVRGGEWWEHLAFSFSVNSLRRNSGSYNAHLEYRRAVAHAIDRDRLVEEIHRGLVAPLGSYVEPFAPWLSAGAWDRYDYDPDAARDYLAQLCAKEAVDCEERPPRAVFTSTVAREPLAELLEEMLTEVGIEVVTELEPSGLFLGDTLDTGEWDLAAWSWGSSPGLGSLLGMHTFSFNPNAPPPAGLNNYRWGTPAVTDAEFRIFNQGESLLIDEHTRRAGDLAGLLTRTVDERTIATRIREFEEILADQMVFLPLYPQELDASAVWADTLEGFVHNRTASTFTWNIAWWYRLDR